MQVHNLDPSRLGSWRITSKLLERESAFRIMHSDVERVVERFRHAKGTLSASACTTELVPLLEKILRLASSNFQQALNSYQQLDSLYLKARHNEKAAESVFLLLCVLLKEALSTVAYEDFETLFISRLNDLLLVYRQFKAREESKLLLSAICPAFIDGQCKTNESTHKKRMMGELINNLLADCVQNKIHAFSACLSVSECHRLAVSMERFSDYEAQMQALQILFRLRPRYEPQSFVQALWQDERFQSRFLELRADSFQSQSRPFLNLLNGPSCPSIFSFYAKNVSIASRLPLVFNCWIDVNSRSITFSLPANLNNRKKGGFSFVEIFLSVETMPRFQFADKITIFLPSVHSTLKANCLSFDSPSDPQERFLLERRFAPLEKKSITNESLHLPCTSSPLPAPSIDLAAQLKVLYVDGTSFLIQSPPPLIPTEPAIVECPPRTVSTSRQPAADDLGEFLVDCYRSAVSKAVQSMQKKRNSLTEESMCRLKALHRRILSRVQKRMSKQAALPRASEFRFERLRLKKFPPSLSFPSQSVLELESKPVSSHDRSLSAAFSTFTNRLTRLV